VALAEWLPAVLQRVRPFVSDKDIHSGARWQAEITGRLEVCAFGIVVVTPENQSNSWLQFEAGALSKAVKDSRVVPLLVDLKKSDLLLPLNMFRAETLDQTGTASLLASLNAATPDPMPEGTVASLAEKWWPDLEAAISELKLDDSRKSAPAARTDRELLEELVTMVRSMRNALTHGSAASDEALQALRDQLTGVAPELSEADKRLARPRRSFVTWATQRLQDEDITLESVGFTGPSTVTFDVGGQHVPGELADEIGRRALKIKLGVWLTNVEGQPDLHYDGSLL
jgi:hypothetical protein